MWRELPLAALDAKFGDVAEACESVSLRLTADKMAILAAMVLF